MLAMVMIISLLPRNIYAEEIAGEVEMTEGESADSVGIEEMTEGESADSVGIEEMTEGESADSVGIEEVTEDESVKIEEMVPEEKSQEIDDSETVDRESEASVTKTKDIEENDTVSEEETLTSFDRFYCDIDTSGMNFLSCELIIGTEDSSIFTSDTEVVSEYKGVYLTRYADPQETESAYTYYYNRADIVEINNQFKADQEADFMDEESDRDGKDEAVMENLNSGDDSISNLNNMEAGDYSGYVALIDTGFSDGMKSGVSVIGDSIADDNGHGTNMARAMLEVNPDINILSVKALDSGAYGRVSDVYAAIQYAIEANVSIINLSISSTVTAESQILNQAIEQARARGILVVSSAGNNGRNASYYTPGNIEGVITIGGVDEAGNIIASSNRGSVVDYYVKADSTSVAAAKFSAYLTVYDLQSINDAEGVFSRQFVEEKAYEASVEGEKAENEITGEEVEEESKDESKESEEDSEQGEEVDKSGENIEDAGNEIYAKTYGPHVELDENGEPWNIVDKGEDYIPSDEEIEAAEKIYGNNDKGKSREDKNIDEEGLMQTPSLQDFYLHGAAYNYEYVIADVTLNDHGRSIGAATFDVVNVHITTPDNDDNVRFVSGQAYCMKHGAYNPFYHGTGWHNNDVTVDGVSLKYQYTDDEGYWVYYNDGSEGYPYVYLPQKSASYTDPTSAVFQYLRVTLKIKHTKESGNYINFIKKGITDHGSDNIWFGVWGWNGTNYQWIGYTKTGHNSSYPGQAYYIYDDINGRLHNSGTTYQGGISASEKTAFGNYLYLQELGYWGENIHTENSDYKDFFYNTKYSWNKINAEIADSYNSGNWDYHNYVFKHDIPYNLAASEMASLPTGGAKTYCVPCSDGFAYHTISLIDESDFKANRFSTIWNGSSSVSGCRGIYNSISNGNPTYAAFAKVDKTSRESLSNISLGFYSDADCTKLLGKAITGTDGVATIAIDSAYSGDYSVKELAADGEYGASVNGNIGRVWKNVHTTFTSLEAAKNWAVSNPGTQELKNFYVGIKKVDKDTNEVLKGTKFIVYGSNTDMTAETFDKAKAGSINGNGVYTNSEGWIAQDITEYVYNNTFKYFYGYEVETDSDHYIDTSSKSNYIKKLIVSEGKASEVKDVSDFVTYSNPRLGAWLDITKDNGTRNPDKAVDMSKVKFSFYSKSNGTYTELTKGNAIGQYQISSLKTNDNQIKYHVTFNMSPGQKLYLKEDKVAAQNAGFDTDIIPLVSYEGSEKEFNIYESYYEFTTKDKEDNKIDLRISDYTNINISMLKVSDNIDCTSNNPNYDLNGTQFTFYADKGLAKKIGVIEVDSGGKTKLPLDVSDFIDKDLSSGMMKATNIYYKETGSGKNYICDTSLKQYTVKPDQTNVIKESNSPRINPISIIIVKKDEEGNDIPLGESALEGAEFLVSFYPQNISGQFDETKEAERSWIYSTKKGQDGVYKIELNNEAYLVEGDELYKDDDGSVGFPLGFVSIKEVKAPDGYKKEGEFYAKLSGKEDMVYGDENGNLILVSDVNGICYQNHELIDQTSLIKEDQPLRADIDLIKVDENGEAMADVVFQITNRDSGQVINLRTDKNGYASTAAAYASHFKDTNSGLAASGIWFGNLDKINDDYGALFWADYVVREVSCGANAGKQLEPPYIITKKDIEENQGQVISLYDREAVQSDNKYWNMTKPSFRTNAIVVETSTSDGSCKCLAGKGSDIEDYNNQTIVDTIYFNNLRAGTDYTWYTQLMVMDKDGNIRPYERDGKCLSVLTPYSTEAAYDHSRYEKSGSIEVRLEGIDPGNLAEEHSVLVVFETLYLGTYNSLDDLLNKEEVETRYPEYDADDGMDIFPILEKSTSEDSGQVVKPVKIHTSAREAVSEDRVAYPSKESKIIDRVYYWGLEAGKTYTVEGMLGARDDLEEAGLVSEGNREEENQVSEDAEVKYVTSQVVFTPEQSQGFVDVEFIINSSLFKGKDLVIFENLKWGDKVIAQHRDVNDEDQIIHFPEISTVAINTDAKGNGKYDEISKEVVPKKGNAITDIIYYKNLLRNRTYVARGVLVDVETGQELLDAAGRKIVGETIFKIPGIDKGNIDNRSDLRDIALEDGSVLDFTPDYSECFCQGEVEVIFEGYDLTNMAGKTGVVYEEVYLMKEDSDSGSEDENKKSYEENGNVISSDKKSEILVGQHKELDKNQFVSFVDIETEAIDRSTGVKVLPYDSETLIEDKVSYNNVIPGKEYTLRASLHVKGCRRGGYKDGDVLVDDESKPISVSTTFIPEESSGEIIMEIPFDTRNLECMEVVVFEELYNSYGLLVAEHSDMEDKNQTISVPVIGTQASIDGEKVSQAKVDTVLLDIVKYDNLLPGLEYRLEGLVIDKESGEPLKINGQDLRVEVIMEPKSSSGYAEVVFNFDGSKINGDMVVYERLYYKDKLIAKHEDINDENQTVTINKPVVANKEKTKEVPEEVTEEQPKGEISTEVEEIAGDSNVKEEPVIENARHMPHTEDSVPVMVLIFIVDISVLGIIILYEIKKRRLKKNK